MVPIKELSKEIEVQKKGISNFNPRKTARTSRNGTRCFSFFKGYPRSSPLLSITF